MIKATILADSLNPIGNRLTTFVITYPRFILAEVNTHRSQSRNSASSRAIPVSKVLRDILSCPAEPVFWGANQSGMQARAELSPSKRWLARAVWLASCWTQVGFSWLLAKLGVHKQIANRLTEPYAYMTTIISGTEWGNFFNLRAHPDAQPEFQALAYAMLEAYVASTPKQLQAGEWHVPFGDKLMGTDMPIELKLKVATARCARVSYLTFDGKHEQGKDCQLHDDLLASSHCSPFEHSARAEAGPVRSGNLVGFTQYRKLLPNENRETFDPLILLSQRGQK